MSSISTAAMPQQLLRNTCAARLDRLPPSGFHRRLTALIGAGMFVDGYDIYLSGGVSGALVESGWATLQQAALLVSSSSIGLAVGAFLFGLFADRYGRCLTFRITMALIILGCLGCAAAPSIQFMAFARFISGLGLGAETAMVWGVLSEFVPPKVRGRYIGFVAFIVTLAVLFSSGMSYLVIPLGGWRWMYGIAAVLTACVWIVRLRVPESPRWLESRGRYQEADAVVSRIEQYVARHHVLPEVENRSGDAVAESAQAAVGMGALFGPANLKRIVLAIWLSITFNVVNTGFLGWLPTFFVKEGLPISKSLGMVFLMSIGGPLGSLLGGYLFDRFPRKRSIVISSLLITLVGIGYAELNQPWLIVLFGFLLFTAVFVMGTLTMPYLAEIFPTEYRMSSVGLANSFGRAINIGLPFLIVSLLTAFGVIGVIGMLIMVVVTQILLVLVMGSETSGKSLEITSH